MRTNEHGAGSPERRGFCQLETKEKHCLFYSFASGDISSRAGRANSPLKQIYSIWFTRNFHSQLLLPNTAPFPVNSHTQNGPAALPGAVTLKCLMLAEPKTGDCVH